VLTTLKQDAIEAAPIILALPGASLPGRKSQVHTYSSYLASVPLQLTSYIQIVLLVLLGRPLLPGRLPKQSVPSLQSIFLKHGSCHCLCRQACNEDRHGVSDPSVLFLRTARSIKTDQTAGLLYFAHLIDRS
jgi:hypothetical protein